MHSVIAKVVPHRFISLHMPRAPYHPRIVAKWLVPDVEMRDGLFPSSKQDAREPHDMFSCICAHMSFLLELMHFS